MIFLLAIGGWLVYSLVHKGKCQCKWYDNGCQVPYGVRGCGGGGGETEIVKPEPAPTAGQTAEEIYQAQLKYNPLAAQQSFDIQSNPQYGTEAVSRLNEQARQNIFPEETRVREQMVQNILQNLISPTGISPDQQTSQDAIRQRAQDQLTQSVRESSNLGGGLYGGRREQREDRGVSEMLQGFAESDINREERSRLNAILAALPVLQALYPNMQLSSPTFDSPVPGANTAYQGGISQYGTQASLAAQQAQINQQQQQAQNAMWAGMVGSVAKGAGEMGSAAIAKSSIELKEKVSPINSALEKTTKIQGVTFNWKETKQVDGGVIAEQLEEVLPEAVIEVKGVKHIKPMMLIGYLIESVKDLSRQIEEMRGESCQI